MDGKARVKIGSFDRGGKSRDGAKADDHDYNPKTTVTPYGIFLPELNELFLYFTESKVTSDFIVDILEDFWLEQRNAPHATSSIDFANRVLAKPLMFKFSKMIKSSPIGVPMWREYPGG